MENHHGTEAVAVFALQILKELAPLTEFSEAFG